MKRPLASIVGFGAAAVLFVILTRGRLGYDRYQQSNEANAGGEVFGSKGIPT